MQSIYETFIGRLGKSPELKYTKEGTAVCYLSVAINYENNPTPRWQQVVIWGKQAEDANLRLKKGSEVFVHGRIQQKVYINKKTEISKEYQELNARVIGFTSI